MKVKIVFIVVCFLFSSSGLSLELSVANDKLKLSYLKSTWVYPLLKIELSLHNLQKNSIAILKKDVRMVCKNNFSFTPTNAYATSNLQQPKNNKKVTSQAIKAGDRILTLIFYKPSCITFDLSFSKIGTIRQIKIVSYTQARIARYTSSGIDFRGRGYTAYKQGNHSNAIFFLNEYLKSGIYKVVSSHPSVAITYHILGSAYEAKSYCQIWYLAT